MSKNDIHQRIIAHNNEFQVGDIINFFFTSGGEEQEGELIEIVDCVYGRVKMPYGIYRIPLSTAKILKRVQHPGDHEITNHLEPINNDNET